MWGSPRPRPVVAASAQQLVLLPSCVDADPLFLSSRANHRCVDRLEQREDDTMSAIERRLQIYEEETEMLVSHYRARTEVKDILITGGSDVMMPVFRRALGIDQ